MWGGVEITISILSGMKNFFKSNKGLSLSIG